MLPLIALSIIYLYRPLFLAFLISSFEKRKQLCIMTWYTCFFGILFLLPSLLFFFYLLFVLFFTQWMLFFCAAFFLSISLSLSLPLLLFSEWLLFHVGCPCWKNQSNVVFTLKSHCFHDYKNLPLASESFTVTVSVFLPFSFEETAARCHQSAQTCEAVQSRYVEIRVTVHPRIKNAYFFFSYL